MDILTCEKDENPTIQELNEAMWRTIIANQTEDRKSPATLDYEARYWGFRNFHERPESWALRNHTPEELERRSREATSLSWHGALWSKGTVSASLSWAISE